MLVSYSFDTYHSRRVIGIILNEFSRIALKMSVNVKQSELAHAMKSGMRRLVSGVSVVSTRDSAGRAYAMTVSSVTSVSDEPPSLLVCINKGTQIAPVLVEHQHFAISVLGQHQTDVSIMCSTGDQSEKRLKVGNWFCDDGKIPHLKDAEAVFECMVDTVLPYGSHNIVVAKISSVQISSQAASPLVYGNGAYHHLKPA